MRTEAHKIQDTKPLEVTERELSRMIHAWMETNGWEQSYTATIKTESRGSTIDGAKKQTGFKVKLIFTADRKED